MFLSAVDGADLRLFIIDMVSVRCRYLVRVLAIPRERVSKLVGSDALLGHRILLFHHLFFHLDFSEPGML